MTEPTLRLGSSGPEVQRLQELLTQRGYAPGEIDGRFGPRTQSAVFQFQGDHGLGVDGIVGPRTWAALLGGVMPGVHSSGGRGISIHIGVNRIDPAHYGTAGILHGCENDARAMQAIAVSAGFQSQVLLTEAATSSAVLGALSTAASTLDSGEILFLTYAGHGAQVPDLTGEEEDTLDETWCLYDRMLIDNELSEAWGQFRPGVRILLLSDSCHSGTMSRRLAQSMAIVKEIYTASLAAPSGGARELVTPGVRDVLRTLPLPRLGAVNGTRGADDGQGAVVTRNLPNAFAAAILDEYRAMYEGLQRAGGARTAPSATVVLISGCQDNQLSQESGGRGAFSTTLERVWAGGTFAGDHPAFHRQILAQMPPTQSPNYTVVGASNPAFEQQKPFTISAPAARGIPGVLIPA